jgi:hypothetical protein
MKYIIAAAINIISIIQKNNDVPYQGKLPAYEKPDI